LVAIFEGERNQDTMREIPNFLPQEASLRTFDFDGQTKDGLRLKGTGWEPDGAPWAAISLIHGLGEHTGRYAHVGEFLAGSGIAVLGFDLRGHGRSQGKLGHTPSYDHLYDDISRGLGVARDRYAGVPLFIYGHSLGATLALLCTIERSPDVRGIVATGPIFKTAFEPPRLKIVAGRVLDRLMPAFTMYNEINPEHISRVPAVVKAYVEDPLVHNRISSRMGIGMLDLGLGLLKRAKELKVPVLLMCGSEDRLTSTAASREFANSAGPICTFKVWEGLYHEIHNEPEQDQVFTHIVDWMRSRLARA
jgi:alpha-beta hydrolase superfamily lysophospholipase